MTTEGGGVVLRVLKAFFARPVLGTGARVVRRRARAGVASRPAPRRLPGPVRPHLQRHRAEPGDERGGAGDGHRHTHGGRAQRPARRAAHPVHLAARRGPDHGRVRFRGRLQPVAPVRRRARRPGRRADAARDRRAAPVEPHRPPERDLRVHAGGRGGHGRPDDAPRPRRVRGQEPPPRRPRGRGRGEAGRSPAAVPGPARSRPRFRAAA